MWLLAEEPLIDWEWVSGHTEEIRQATVEHVTMTATAVGIGFTLAMSMALIAVRWRWTYGIMASFCGVLYAVPSLALFGILVPITGLGMVPAQVALVGYTLLILLRNIVAGLDGVAADVKEAADGMGFEPWRRMLQVDLPVATPAIIAGLRIATVTTIGLVTVASIIGPGGFGNFITKGLQRQFSTEVMIGVLGSVALAVLFDLLFVALEWMITPWRRARAAGEKQSAAKKQLAGATGSG